LDGCRRRALHRLTTERGMCVNNFSICCFSRSTVHSVKKKFSHAFLPSSFARPLSPSRYMVGESSWHLIFAICKNALCGLSTNYVTRKMGFSQTFPPCLIEIFSFLWKNTQFFPICVTQFWEWASEACQRSEDVKGIYGKSWIKIYQRTLTDKIVVDGEHTEFQSTKGLRRKKCCFNYFVSTNFFNEKMFIS
jgi:hypothetical protein